MARWERFREQMRRVGRLTGAKWSTWLVPTNGGWQVVVGWGLTAARRRALAATLESAEWRAWLSGALVQGRHRRRTVTPPLRKTWGSYLHAFPRKGEGVLLVAGKSFDGAEKEMWRVVALAAPSEDFGEDLPQPLCERFAQRLADSDVRLPRVAKAVAATLREQAEAPYAYLAVREGRTWRILAAEGEALATWKPRPVPVERLSLPKSLWEGEIVTLPAEPWPGGAASDGGAWVGIPLMQRKRLIGFVAMALPTEASLSPAWKEQFSSFAQRVGWVLEQSLAFEEMAAHLRRKAVLNDVLLAMLSSEDVEEATLSATRHLRRVLQADVAMVMLPTRDGLLEPVGVFPAGPLPRPVPIAKSLCGQVLETGKPARVGDVRKVARYIPFRGDIRSELCVPLRSKAEVIGVLNLESVRLDAFTEEDERLLMAVAGHLALMLEVIRLREDAAARAQRMELVHQVIKKIVGLLDVGEVVEVAARHIAAYFGYEITVVAVTDEKRTRPLFYGAAGGGSRQRSLDLGASTWPSDGVIAYVLQTGQSMLVEDTDAEPRYRFFPGFKAGSELCVPLLAHEEGGSVIGFINIERAEKYAFTQEDAMAMETIASALSAVLTSARRYERLEVTIRHLQAARQTALDLTADLRMETLLQRIVGRVKRLLEVQGVEIGLVDPQKNEIRIVAADAPKTTARVGFAMPLGGGIGGRVAVSGQTLVVDDYPTWEGRERRDTPAAFQAAVSVPLKFGEEILGVLTVYDDAPERKFTADEVMLLELVAPQIAVALRNAGLYQELADRMEAQARAERELEKAGRLAAMVETATSIAHELNDPMTTAAGFMELALDDLAEGRNPAEDLQMAYKETRRLGEIVRRLLDFARHPESYTVASDVNLLVEETLAVVSRLMASRGVMPQVSLAADLPLVVADQVEVKQVLLNLVHLLLGTMPQGGKLYITTALEEDSSGRWVVVRMADTGLEITSEQQEKVFGLLGVGGAPESQRQTAGYAVVREDSSTFVLGKKEKEHIGNVFALYLPVV